MTKKNENQFKVLNDFEQGQLDVLKTIKAYLQKQVAIIENMHPAEWLNSTREDVLFGAKITMKHALFKNLIAKIEILQNELKNKEK